MLHDILFVKRIIPGIYSFPPQLLTILGQRMPGPVAMAVRNPRTARVYIPASVAPDLQFHAPFSPSFPSPTPLGRKDSEDSCVRRPRFGGLMPSSPFAGRTILVTGGAGYIGSHTVLQLLKGCFRVVVADNLDNSSHVAVERVRELAGEFGKNLVFHRVRIETLPILGFNLESDFFPVFFLICAFGHIFYRQQIFFFVILD